jgi:predicted DNA-binding antitoxin AbrB/MazE fold protein
MSQIIDVIYEDGVFKPSQHVDVKEHEKVAIKVVLIDEWQD